MEVPLRRFNKSNKIQQTRIASHTLLHRAKTNSEHDGEACMRCDWDMRTALLLLALTFAVTTTTFASTTAKAGDQSTTQTVPYVDLNHFYGEWFVIASKPSKYERNCNCSRQIMSPKSRANDDKIKIQISCNKISPQGLLKTVSLTAKNTDPQTNSRFRATYKLFFKFDYFVIGLAQDYAWTVITDSSGSMLYILSKTPTLPLSRYNEAITAAAAQRDVTQLVKVNHQGCVYPNL